MKGRGKKCDDDAKVDFVMEFRLYILREILVADVLEVMRFEI